MFFVKFQNLITQNDLITVLFLPYLLYSKRSTYVIYQLPLVLHYINHKMFEIYDLNFDLNFFGPSESHGKSSVPNSSLCTLFPEKLG